MSQPYVGQILIFGCNFAPAGWALCQGQLLAISENQTLFQLIGTTYGGDGQSTFGLPDLRSRLPVHMGTGRTGTTYTIGEAAGAESVTLTANQIPVHTHVPLASSSPGNRANPAGAYWAKSAAGQFADGTNNSGLTALPQSPRPVVQSV